MTTVGIDIGSMKTTMVDHTADIVLTDTGSISRPTLISFYDKSRLVGEEAAPQISGDSTISMLNLLLGKSEDSDFEIKKHRRNTFLKVDEQLVVEVCYRNKNEQFSMTSLLGLFVSKLQERINSVYGSGSLLAFSLPPAYDLSYARAVKEACIISGGIDLSRVVFVDSSDGLVATYGRKLQALRAPEKAALEHKKSIIIEVGHTQSIVIVTSIGGAEDACSMAPMKLGYAHDAALGGLYFDFKLFEYFASICEKNHGTKVMPGTKRGQRLLLGCERVRKLLSQLPDAKITVENLTDNGDVNFSLRRDDLANICADLTAKFTDLIAAALQRSGVDKADIQAVEIVGGGIRMPILQQAIQAMFGSAMVLGAKLDDGSAALGAALVAAASTDAEKSAYESSIVLLSALDNKLDAARGLGVTQLAAASAREQELQVLDAELVQLLAARNKLESYVLEMRSVKRRKYGDQIDAKALDQLLDDSEGWMYDNPDAALTEVESKNSELEAAVAGVCRNYFAAVEADRQLVEESLSRDADAAAAQRAASGEDDEDHDNRKLRKADRMRLVVKNKEEGTELFKGGNFRPAAARYHKALTHIAKFFDLGPDDQKEIQALKITLWLNLASCYLKLEQYDRVFQHCNDTLEAEPANVKALYRRSIAYEAKKDWEKAFADVRKCQELNDTEDKLVTKAADRIKKEIAKQKAHEKKVWGKAFS